MSTSTMFIPYHITDTWIDFPQPKAINSLSYQFSLDSIPNNSCYYYWAYYSTLSDGQGWYVGFQNNGNLNGSTTSPLINFSVWGATDGKSGTNGIAQNFSHEGVGFRTATPYNFQAGDIYTITITQLNNNLNCYLQNKKTDISTFIGSVTLNTNQNLTSNPGCLFNEVYMPVKSANDIFPVTALWNNFQINNTNISNLTRITPPPFHDDIDINNNVSYFTIVTNNAITQFTGGDGSHTISLNSDNSAVYLGNGPDIINWGIENNDSIDGGSGNDSLNTFNEFSSYKFSNLNLATSSVTLTNIDSKNSVNLKSIENFVFTDKTVPFSQITIQNTVPIGIVTITGTATQNKTLTASNNLTDADGLGAIGYTWLRDGNAINEATQSTYTLTQADVGKKITVNASYTDLLGTAESVSSTATSLIANVNDAPNGMVTITGTATQNQTLTASNNLTDADGLGAISYAWLSNGAVIPNAKQSTYTLTQADVGKAISVKASYTDVLGAAENVSSTATSLIANVNDVPTGTVTITGAVTQDQTLTASNNLVDADELGKIIYTWLRDGMAISDATQSTYILTQSDVGKKISVKASYTDRLGTAESVISSATSVVNNVNDAPTGSVNITGTAIKDQVLTVANTLADPDGLGKISYTWLKNGAIIPNATQSTYKLTQADTGQNISVKASYIDLQDTPESVMSSSVLVAPNSAPTGAATIKWLSTWGTTLSITSTIKDADGLGALSYTWQNDSGELSASSKYTLQESDVGKQVWALVSYTDKKGNFETVKSNVIGVTVSTKPSAVNDILTGTDTADKLSGLAGDDTLIGGLGKDTLTGGVGADVFKFTSISDSAPLSKQADTITDFKHTQGDKIDLSAIDINPTLAGRQSFIPINSQTFSADATGQLRFDAKTSTLYGSTNSDSAPEFAIVLSGVKSLVAEDFIL